MITYTALDGTTKTAEIWSPGPAARSVWVIHEDGTTAAVHMVKRTELLNVPADPRNWQARTCSIIGQPNHTSTACRCESSARRIYRDEFRYAPAPVKPSEWKRGAALFEIEV